MKIQNYYEVHVKCRLKEIAEWNKSGLSRRTICSKLGIGLSTLGTYTRKYPELAAVSMVRAKNKNKKISNSKFDVTKPVAETEVALADGNTTIENSRTKITGNKVAEKITTERVKTDDSKILKSVSGRTVDSMLIDFIHDPSNDSIESLEKLAHGATTVNQTEITEEIFDVKGNLKGKKTKIIKETIEHQPNLEALLKLNDIKPQKCKCSSKKVDLSGIENKIAEIKNKLDDHMQDDNDADEFVDQFGKEFDIGDDDF